jgi:SAM-dependent methyltransferase
MAWYAAQRIARVVLADCTALPVAADSLDAVTAIWLLHLIDDVAGMIAEAARVLRTGGVLITTVDKDAAHDVTSDVDAVLRPFRNPDPSDKAETVRRYGADHGLYDAGSADFIGHGQGRTPRGAAANLRGGHFTSAFRASAAEREALAATLERLPGQDVRRPDPRYRLIALRKT